MAFSAGMTVRLRGQRCVVLDAQPIVGAEAPSNRLRLRATEGPLRGQEWPVVDTLEEVTPDELPDLSLERIGRDARFRLLHEAFQLTLAPPPTALIAAGRSRIHFHMYQQIPALRMLALPRPRILNASDVGLGKTIETGIALRELISRRRGGRILIVCPAGIMEQWQEELATKFGLDFRIFDRDGVHEAKKQIELGGNAWATEPRIIASFDYLKRRDGVFREVQNIRFNVIVCDECHHLAQNLPGEHDISDRHRLAQWVSKACDALLLLSATPHSGYDKSFASLLNLLEPTLVPDIKAMRYRNYSRHLIRHLKRHIKNPDGSDFFVPANPSKPIPVTLSQEEAAVHAAVAKQAGALDEQAERLKSARDKYALRLVATILRKRASSSLSALRSTVTRRLENLEKDAEDVEVRRDHLRALRKGETISDEALSQLELDAHRSFLARIRSAGKKLRTIEQESQDLLDLQELLAKCPADTDSKAEALRTELKAIHDAHPTDKIIIFSEYADTVEWLVEFLTRNGYEGKLVQYDGSLTGPQRKKSLADFATPEILLLVSTDSAAEGLNLQTHCHRVIHIELPFNPNRMLQRQGRVDRFGQAEVCEFGFLYAKDTYEGEVLKRLLVKIERQVLTVGSVGDVLGALQADRIEALISQSPDDVKAAIEDADRKIDEELARVNAARDKEMMGDDGLTDGEVAQLRTAIEDGKKITVDPVSFVERAVTLAGGKCQRDNGLLRVPQVPQSWVGGKVPLAYEALYTSFDAAPPSAKPDEVIDDEHPLVQNAIRWVRESRYDPKDDHRVAAKLLDDIDAPDIVVTFIATVRANDNTEMQRLLAIRVDAGGATDPSDAFELLQLRGVGNVPADQLPAIFGNWWQSAREKAEAEAASRAKKWRDEVKQKRHVEDPDLRDKLIEWNSVTRAAILHGQDDPTSFLPGMERKLPPTVARRLREHTKEYEQQESFLNRRLEFEEPTIEPLGVLLRVPSKGVE